MGIDFGRFRARRCSRVVPGPARPGARQSMPGPARPGCPATFAGPGIRASKILRIYINLKFSYFIFYFSIFESHLMNSKDIFTLRIQIVPKHYSKNRLWPNLTNGKLLKRFFYSIFTDIFVTRNKFVQEYIFPGV